MDAEWKDAGKAADTVNPGEKRNGRYTLDFQIPRDQVEDSLREMVIPALQDRIRTERESDQSYHQVAEQIIRVSQKHLSEQQRDKTLLRRLFARVFCALLVAEYVILVLLILLDGAAPIPVEISDSILQLYTASVFAQTLGTMGVMITFAFVSKEETRIIGLLNQIIRNYQKVKLDDGEEPEKEAADWRGEGTFFSFS